MVKEVIFNPQNIFTGAIDHAPQNLLRAPVRSRPFPDLHCTGKCIICQYELKWNWQPRIRVFESRMKKMVMLFIL
jgi:hypothetical protein